MFKYNFISKKNLKKKKGFLINGFQNIPKYAIRLFSINF